DPDFVKPTDNLHAHRNKMIGIFAALGFHCTPPQGGCYIMADIRPFTSEDSESLAYRFLHEARVLVAPGQLFFSPDNACGTQLIRMAFNRKLDLLDEVERRLALYQPTAKPRRPHAATTSRTHNQLLRSVNPSPETVCKRRNLVAAQRIISTVGMTAIARFESPPGP
nr:hypothetical protein [Actinomycetota bacterium]